jgi:hypothetical protein
LRAAISRDCFAKSPAERRENRDFVIHLRAPQDTRRAARRRRQWKIDLLFP